MGFVGVSNISSVLDLLLHVVNCTADIMRLKTDIIKRT